MPKRKRSNPGGKEGETLKMIFLFLLGALLSAALAVGLCAVLANAMCTTDIEPSLLVPLTTALLCASILLASLLLSLLCQGRIWVGPALALFLFLMISVAAFVVTHNFFTALWVTKGAAFLASGALGGYLGALLRARKRKMRR